MLTEKQKQIAMEAWIKVPGVMEGWNVSEEYMIGLRGKIDSILDKRTRPQEKTPEERVTVRRKPGCGLSVYQDEEQCGPDFLNHEDAERYRRGLIAELKEQP